MESDTQAYLLVLKSKDGKLTVLEFENENFLNGKLEAAVKLGIWCQRLNNVEELDREEFQGAKFLICATRLFAKYSIWNNGSTSFK